MLALALLLYQLLFPLIAVGVIVRLFAEGRGRALRESGEQLRQRLGLLTEAERARLQGTVLWVHAASAGEVNAAAPLAAALAALPQAPRILLTTSTAAGRDRARALPGVALAALSPMDFYPALRAFLGRARPRALILVETELWPLTLHLAQRSGLLLALVNGRLSAGSFAGYRRLGGALRRLLESFACAAVQTEEDAARFRKLGIRGEAVRVTGNLKLDLPPPGEDARRRAEETLSALGWAGDPVWAAGCLRAGEEEAVLGAFVSLKPAHPRLRLVLAPRHVERAGSVAAILRQRGVRFTRLSEKGAPRPVDCLLLDAMGPLAGFYGAARVAFVGGTLVPVGGHNLLEPAQAGVPVLFGPHTGSVEAGARALERSGGGIRVGDAAGLGRELGRLLADPALLAETGRRAREAAQGLSGATRRTLEALAPLLAALDPLPRRKML